MFATLMKNRRIKHLCVKGEHRWDYCTWGNATVDNMDDTYSLCELQTRKCPDCGKKELLLKNGWQEKRGQVTIHDIK